MPDSYYRDFWIVTDKGKKLHPKLIVDRHTKIGRYQFLAKGSNSKEDGSSTTDPVEAVRRFLAGESLRFGNDGEKANRFDLRGGHVASHGMLPALKAALKP